MDAFEARLMSSEAAKVDVVPGFTASHHGDAGGDLRHRANAGGRHGRIQGSSRSCTVPGSPPLSMLWGLADSCGELGRRRDVARELRACQADNHIYTMEAHAQLPVGAGRSVGQAPSTPPVRLASCRGDRAQSRHPIPNLKARLRLRQSTYRQWTVIRHTREGERSGETELRNECT